MVDSTTLRHAARGNQLGTGPNAVNHHLVVKLRRALDAGLDVPDWHHFILNKSVVHEQIEPSVDRVMRDYRAPFWLTREYAPAGADWDDEERRHGLDRTYRLILQHDDRLPAALVEAIRALPVVERVHGVDVAAAPLRSSPRRAQSAPSGPAISSTSLTPRS
jgi:thermitase